MLVARILYPVRTLGPGDRIGIWFSGCPRQCPGCSNPELREPDGTCEISLDGILAAVRGLRKLGAVDGFTLTGGEPFMQPGALSELLPALAEISDDILVYTGFRVEELESAHPDLLAKIGVLIDGEYVEERNRGEALRGSSNQRILVLRESLRSEYESYLAQGERKVQNFPARDGFISVGIHAPDYEKGLEEALGKKGLMRNERIPSEMA